MEVVTHDTRNWTIPGVRVAGRGSVEGLPGLPSLGLTNSQGGAAAYGLLQIFTMLKIFVMLKIYFTVNTRSSFVLHNPVTSVTTN